MMNIQKTIAYIVLVGALSTHQLSLTAQPEIVHSDLLVSELIECECQGTKVHVPLTAEFLQRIEFVQNFNAFYQKMFMSRDQKKIPTPVLSIARSLQSGLRSVHLEDLVEVLKIMLIV